MRDIPVMLGGYRLMVTEAPMMKMREKDGQMEPVIDKGTKAAQFVVALFAKRLPGPDGFVQKGEEIKVTLLADPGEGCEEGSYVELIDPRINSYSMQTEDGRTISGISFKAAGLKLAVRVASAA